MQEGKENRKKAQLSPSALPHGVVRKDRRTGLMVSLSSLRVILKKPLLVRIYCQETLIPSYV